MWFKKSVAAVVEAPPIVLPIRVPLATQMTDEDRQMYVEKAKSLGVVNAALKQEMLASFLKENGICAYPLDKVEAYLDGVFGKSTSQFHSTWGWRPLRPEDNGKLRSNHGQGNGRIMSGTYQQAVPMPVLLTVEKIIAAVPDVHFYVSDQERVSDLDPFLAVSATGMNMVVVERWDEPSFRV